MVMVMAVVMKVKMMTAVSCASPESGGEPHALHALSSTIFKRHGY